MPGRGGRGGRGRKDQVRRRAGGGAAIPGGRWRRSPPTGSTGTGGTVSPRAGVARGVLARLVRLSGADRERAGAVRTRRQPTVSQRGARRPYRCGVGSCLVVRAAPGPCWCWTGSRTATSWPDTGTSRSSYRAVRRHRRPDGGPGRHESGSRSTPAWPATCTANGCIRRVPAVGERADLVIDNSDLAHPASSPLRRPTRRDIPPYSPPPPPPPTPPVSAPSLPRSVSSPAPTSTTSSC